jgi:hypothetical protein
MAARRDADASAGSGSDGHSDRRPSNAVEEDYAFRAQSPVERLVDSFFGIAYVLGLVLARSIGLQSVREIGFDDESISLYLGMRMFSGGTVAADRSPLYQLWYWLQSLVVGDPVSLYYVNWSALLFSNLLILWVLLGWMRVSRVLSVVLLAVFSTLTLFEVWPYVSLLSMAGVGIAMRLTFGLRSWIDTLSTLSAVFGILAFVRPELTMSFLLSLLVLGCVSWVQSGTVVQKGIALALAVVPFVLLCVVFGSPFGGGRLFVAFGQHYSMNVTQAESRQADPWNSWEEITRRDFGGSKSVSDALRMNPERVAWHIHMNFRNVTSLRSIFAPDVDSPRARTGLGLLVMGGVLLGGVMGLRSIYARGAQAFVTDHTPQSHVLVATALAAAPSVVSIVLVYPRAHYVVAPCVGLLVFSTWGLSELLMRMGLPRGSYWPGVAAAGIGCLAVLPGSSGLEPWFLRWATATSEPGHLESIATIRTLRRLPLSIGRDESVSVLEADYSRGVYAGWQVNRISQTECRPFLECVSREHPEIVVDSIRLQKHYLALKDGGYEAFLARPEALGYRRVQVPGQATQIFVREDLLGQPRAR